jgi:hypothetical protein
MTPPVGPPCELNVTPEDVINASGWRCGCASLFEIYLSSSELAADSGIGVEDMCRWGGGASGSMVDVD